MVIDILINNIISLIFWKLKDAIILQNIYTKQYRNMAAIYRQRRHAELNSQTSTQVSLWVHIAVHIAYLWVYVSRNVLHPFYYIKIHLFILFIYLFKKICYFGLLVRRPPFNRMVGGSNPTTPTNLPTSFEQTWSNFTSSDTDDFYRSQDSR